jgi:hypothetical protein
LYCYYYCLLLLFIVATYKRTGGEDSLFPCPLNKRVEEIEEA